MRLTKMFHNSVVHETALTCLMSVMIHSFDPSLTLDVLSCFLESFTVESASIYTKYCSLVGMCLGN